MSSQQNLKNISTFGSQTNYTINQNLIRSFILAWPCSITQPDKNGQLCLWHPGRSKLSSEIFRSARANFFLLKLFHNKRKKNRERSRREAEKINLKIFCSRNLHWGYRSSSSVDAVRVLQVFSQVCCLSDIRCSDIR